MANKEDQDTKPSAADAEAAAAKKKERAERAQREKKPKKTTEPTGPAPKYKREQLPRLRKTYEATVRPTMMKEFEYTSIMQVPRLVKVTLNMGLGRANQDSKVIESAVEEMKAITGQAPVVCKAKKDIATYKLRKGQKIGVMVTLRAERMWEFLDRLISVALPRVRDFRGVSPRGFDGRGNFTMGVKEQIIFPEIEYDQIESIKGLNVSIVTTAETDAEGRSLLAHLGLPFRTPAPASIDAAAPAPR